MSDTDDTEPSQETLDTIENIWSATDPGECADHMDDISATIEQLTTGVCAQNTVYAQSHVLQRASELLREQWAAADTKGEHEAELLALAIVLNRQAEASVWDT